MFKEKSTERCFSWFCAAETSFLLLKTSLTLMDSTIRLFLYREACLHVLTGTACYTHDVVPKYQDDSVQDRAANYLWVYKIMYTVPSIFISLLCGSWSDVVGRKIPLVASVVGTAVTSYFYGWADYLSMNGTAIQVALPIILTSTCFNGLTGRGTVFTMAVMAHVADDSDETTRTRRLSRMSAMNYLGLCSGAFLGAWILTKLSFANIYVLTCCILMFAVILVLLGVKDLPPVDCQCTRSSKFFSASAVTDAVDVIIENRPGKNRLTLILLVAAVLLNQTLKAGDTNVTLLFVKRSPLNWSDSAYAYLVGVQYAGFSVVLLLLLPILHKFLSDGHLLTIGIIFKITRLIIFSCNPSTTMVWVGNVFDAFSALIVPVCKSMISKLVQSSKQGKIFGLLACGEAVSSLIGVSAFTPLYQVTSPVFPGAVFLVEAIIYFLIGLVAMIKFGKEKVSK